MYERFSDVARKVMQLANQEAQRFNHEYIDDVHILLGLVKEGRGVASTVLSIFDVKLTMLRRQVEARMQSGPERITMGKLPQTPYAKKAIESSCEIARNLNHNYVGTEHLLLALTQSEGNAGEILRSLGIHEEAAKKAVLKVLGENAGGSTYRIRELRERSNHAWFHEESAKKRAEYNSLVLQAATGFPPYIITTGESQLDKILVTLNRKQRNNVLLIGEPGVGKRALVEHLAGEIASENKVASDICGVEILEASFQSVEKGIGTRQKSKPIFFVEELYSLFTPGLSAPDLARISRVIEWINDLIEDGTRFIATTSPRFSDQLWCHDALMANFTPIKINAANDDLTEEIARSRSGWYAHHYGVRIGDAAIREAIRLSGKYGAALFPLHQQPELTLDTLEHATSRLTWNRQAESSDDKLELTADHVRESVSKRLGKPVD